MKTRRLSRRQRALANCAPLDEERISDRSMRSAVFRARESNEFANQQTFDCAVAALVRTIPIPPDIAEWFSSKDLFSPPKWTWKRTVRNPAVLAVGIALVVIAGVFLLHFLDHLHDFPGSETARKLLTIAASTRSVLLDPVSTDAGALGDLFFMKHRLEHYDVPAEFADFRTIGCRVFDDDESQRIAQIWVTEKRIQFFLFPAERDAKTGAALQFSGWRYVHQEDWVGAVIEHNGVCFMAALRGREKELAPYIPKVKR
jgi:hypothetical protein